MIRIDKTVERFDLFIYVIAYNTRYSKKIIFGLIYIQIYKNINSNI